MAERPKSDLQLKVELLWDTGEQPSRGPRRNLSVPEIVRTAVDIADAEGLDSLSMQRLATELGFTAMSLYRYVPSKEQLVTLMVDAATGAPPEFAEDDWRAELEAWAKGMMAVNRRHPWLLRVQIDGPPIGPNGLAWFEAGLRALSGTGLRSDEMVLLCTFLLGMVQGLLRLSSDIATASPENMSGYDEALASVVTAERFPTLARVFTDRVFEVEPGGDDMSNVDAELEFGLRRLMDGVQRHVAARGGVDTP